MRRRWMAVAMLVAACAEPEPTPECTLGDCPLHDAGSLVPDATAPSDAGSDSGPLDAEGGDATVAHDAAAAVDAAAADASITDAGRWWGDAECSPLPQAGCEAGEACTLRSVVGSGWVAACELAGTFGAGRYCNYAPGQCAAGLFCFNSSCWRFCEVGTTECVCASLEDPSRPGLGRCR